MHLRLLDYVFWLTAPLLQAGALVVMYRRGLHREYPYFFNYTILSVVSEPILYVAQTYSYTTYYYVYYLNIALSALVSFAVLQELFKDAFRPYEALRDLSIILFRWSALVVLLVGVMWAVNVASNTGMNGVVTDAIMLAERSVRLMQCGLVFFLLLFSEYLGISRRSMLFGISMGFGFFAAINMLVVTGMTHHGILNESILSRINSVAYIMAVIIWLGYTWVAEPSKATVAPEPVLPRTLNNALEDVRVQTPAHSLLDDMESTVERLLYPRETSKVNVSAGHVSAGHG